MCAHSIRVLSFAMRKGLLRLLAALASSCRLQFESLTGSQTGIFVIVST